MINTDKYTKLTELIEAFQNGEAGADKQAGILVVDSLTFLVFLSGDVWLLAASDSNLCMPLRLKGEPVNSDKVVVKEGGKSVKFEWTHFYILSPLPVMFLTIEKSVMEEAGKDDSKFELEAKVHLDCPFEALTEHFMRQAVETLKRAIGESAATQEATRLATMMPKGKDGKTLLN